MLAPEPPLVLALPEDVPEAPEAAPLVPSPEAVPVAAPVETPEAATTPLVVAPLVTPLVAPLALAPAVACEPELAVPDPELFVPELPPWMGELELPQLNAVSANRAPRASTRARALVLKRVMQASGFPAGDFALLTSLMQGESRVSGFSGRGSRANQRLGATFRSGRSQARPRSAANSPRFLVCAFGMPRAL